jgi:hypothetical protein
MIATLSEIKRINHIAQSDTSKDTDIKFFMQVCEEEIHDICKNDFIRDRDLINEKYLPSTDTISFEASTYKILDNNNGLYDAFISGNSIKIFGSLENDGIYYVDTVAGNGSYLTIDSDYGSLTDEDAGELISLYKLWYSKSLKFVIAQMINYRLSTDSLKVGKGIKSEKVDDYSITFSNDNKSSESLSGYPSNIMKMLQPHRKYFK